VTNDAQEAQNRQNKIDAENRALKARLDAAIKDKEARNESK
jgi:hypothetical protein